MPTEVLPVAITGFSCVTPFGDSPESLWQACVEGRSCFDEEGLGFIPKSVSQSVAQRWCKALRDSRFEDALQNELLLLSLVMIEEAMQKAEWKSLDRCGIVVATTTGLTKSWERKLMQHFSGQKIEGSIYHPLGSFAVELQNQLNHQGLIQLVSSACSAGTQAIGIGRAWIENGLVDRCLILGAEQICQLTRRGFQSLSLINGEVCRPFNESFNNICLSEAVAVLCLEKQNCKAKSIISGYGCASDGYSMTAPKPDGSGPMHSISAALKEAQLKPQDIDWSHLHGTGSLQNDRAEAAAMKKLQVQTPVTSTKGVHGHSLAAAGVLETLLATLAIQRNTILPTWGAEAKHFNIQICTKSTTKGLRHVLKNTLGFGGINASLILSEVSSND